jgi:hypothetical protein
MQLQPNIRVIPANPKVQTHQAEEFKKRLAQLGLPPSIGVIPANPKVQTHQAEEFKKRSSGFVNEP